MKVLSPGSTAAKTAVPDMADSGADERFNSVIAEFGTLLRQAVSRACPRDRGIEVADVEQDARIRLWRALQSEREIKDLASYIYKIAVTATIDAVRRTKAKREDPLPGGPTGDDHDAPIHLASQEVSPEDRAAGRSMARAVATALTRLATRRRRAVGLHLQGLTTSEVGRVLGWSEPKARNLVYRGLKDLRRELKEMGIDHDVE